MKVARTHEEYHYGNPLPIHAMIPTNKPVQINVQIARYRVCLLYTSPSPRD